MSWKRRKSGSSDSGTMNSREQTADKSRSAPSVINLADPARGDDANEFQGYRHDAGVSFIVVDAPPGGGPKLHRHPYESCGEKSRGNFQCQVWAQARGDRGSRGDPAAHRVLRLDGVGGFVLEARARLHVPEMSSLLPRTIGGARLWARYDNGCWRAEHQARSC